MVIPRADSFFSEMHSQNLGKDWLNVAYMHMVMVTKVLYNSQYNARWNYFQRISLHLPIYLGENVCRSNMNFRIIIKNCHVLYYIGVQSCIQGLQHVFHLLIFYAFMSFACGHARAPPLIEEIYAITYSLQALCLFSRSLLPDC